MHANIKAKDSSNEVCSRIHWSNTFHLRRRNFGLRYLQIFYPSFADIHSQMVAQGLVSHAEREHSGIELPTFLFVDNLLYLLGYSHLKAVTTVKTW